MNCAKTGRSVIQDLQLVSAFFSDACLTLLTTMKKLQTLREVQMLHQQTVQAIILPEVLK